MKSISLIAYGEPKEVLKFINQSKIPEPKNDEVLVKIKAASINPLDCRMRRGYGKTIFGKRAPLPITLGRDFSGTVVKIGSDVEEFKPGDSVWGIVSPFRPAGLKAGSHSEYVCVPVTECAKKPSHLNDVEAASLPYVAATTWTALITQSKRTLESYKNKKVLVHAGAGGVGSFAIQFLKTLGATVATTCSTKNVEYVKSLGADIVVDYKKQDYAKVLHDYDVVYDLLGKEHTEPSLTVLASKPLSPAIQQKIDELLQDALKKLDQLDDNSTVPQYKKILNEFDQAVEELFIDQDQPCYVSIVGPMLLLIVQKGLNAGMYQYVSDTLHKKAQLLKQHGQKFNYSVVQSNKKALNYLTQIVEAKKIIPQVSQVFPLAEAYKAHQAIDTRHVRGKIVLDVANP